MSTPIQSTARPADREPTPPAEASPAVWLSAPPGGDAGCLTSTTYFTAVFPELTAWVSGEAKPAQAAS